MRLQTALSIILPVFASWQQPPHNPWPRIAAIPCPPGFERVPEADGSFASWLRQLPLKKDNTVYLYNGLPKRNQSAQFAVLDVSVGDKDLQQCADAVMRLRAEWLYSRGRLADLDFIDNANTHYRLRPGAGRKEFDQYLEKVFSYCGTRSLSRQLKPKDFKRLEPGDVLILGGSPGHAMLVTDMAVDKNGRKLFLLCQSYMPAQDIHVVINPQNRSLSPWYEVNSGPRIETPEWSFTINQLRTWPAP
jgi:hypothetical protein